MVIRRLVASLLAVSALATTSASAIVRCKTADGRTLFVDSPPPDCAVEREYGSTGSAPAAEGFTAPAAEARSAAEAKPAEPIDPTADAIARRDTIEQEMKRLDAERTALLQERTKIEYPPPPNGGSPAQWEEHRKRVAEIGARRERLERDIAERVERMGKFRAEFSALATDVATKNDGKMPPGFRATLDCPGCP